MGRALIEQGDITVAYGTDHVTGYFLTITDRRLQYASDADEEVNSVCSEVNTASTGGYFNLHTSVRGGFGQSVTRQTLLEFWRRYGVPQEHIQRGEQNLDVPGPIPFTGVPCFVCGKSTMLRCSKCGSIYACSKEHTVQAWKEHKSTCKTPLFDLAKDADHPSKYPIKRAKAYFLPDNAKSPRLVMVDCEVHPPEDGECGYDSSYNWRNRLFKDGFVKPMSVTVSGTPATWQYSGPVIQIYHRDTFLVDGSPLNQCVKHVTRGQAIHPWAGPLLIMKERNLQGEECVDIDDEAFNVATKYLVDYQRWHLDAPLGGEKQKSTTPHDVNPS